VRPKRAPAGDARSSTQPDGTGQLVRIRLPERAPFAPYAELIPFAESGYPAADGYGLN
jgi:hypothetical protein